MTLLLHQESKHTLFLVWRNLPHSAASTSENKNGYLRKYMFHQHFSNACSLKQQDFFFKQQKKNEFAFYS